MPVPNSAIDKPVAATTPVPRTISFTVDLRVLISGVNRLAKL